MTAKSISRYVAMITAVAMCLFAAQSVQASVQYRGDFETGNFSQWRFNQMLGGVGCGVPACTTDQVGNATGIIVTSPHKQGKYAMKCVVASTGGGSSANNRCEVVATTTVTGGVQGQSWWYGWWTYLPGPSQTWWPNGDDWNDVFQFFDETNQEAFIYGGIAANDGTPALYTDGPWGHKIIGDPLKYNHWYHFVVHAKWSTTSNGFWNLRLDGVNVQPKAFIRTMGQSSNPATTFSYGFYSARNTDNTVVQDGFCRASTQAEAAAC